MNGKTKHTQKEKAGKNSQDNRSCRQHKTGKMQRHTAIYFKESGIDPHGFVECEVCGASSVDVNHIDARGMGGNPKKDKEVFENLMASCRRCHNDFADKQAYKEFLKRRHAENFPGKLKYVEETGKIIRI